MFGWLKKKTEYTPTDEERRIIASICNFGKNCLGVYELAPDPVGFEAASGVIVASLMHRPAGRDSLYAVRSGYGVTVREALLALLASINATAVEQFQQQPGTDATGEKKCD